MLWCQSKESSHFFCCCCHQHTLSERDHDKRRIDKAQGLRVTQQARFPFSVMSFTTIIFLLAFLVIAYVTAFSSRPFGAPASIRPTASTVRFMFSADEDTKSKVATVASPLQEVSATEASSMDPASSSTSSEAKSEVVSAYRDLNTGEIKEVKWVDPAMSANSSLEGLSWAYLFLIFPGILLLNDAFHFLPDEGPLSFLARFK